MKTGFFNRKKNEVAKNKNRKKIKKLANMLEYFQPIIRKTEKLKSGNDIASKIYKKFTGAKNKIIGSE